MFTLLFNIIIFIELSKSEIIVDFKSDNTWESTFDTSSSTTFKVSKLLTKYCYVNINLKNNDASFLLIADYKKLPKSELASKYKQGEKIDRISQFENRKTRFLKLKTTAGVIYITVQSDNQQNNYNINITGSDQEICDNQCFSKGVCEIDGCNCQNTFIGNDCHQKSQELFSQTTNQFSFEKDQLIKFFSIDLNPLINQNLRLDFETDCLNCLTIIIYKTKALLQSDNPIHDDLFQAFQIQDGLLTIETRIPYTLSTQQIFNFAVLKKESISTPLQIKFNQMTEDFGDNQDEKDTLIIVIVLVIVVIVIILIIGVMIKRNRKVYPGSESQVIQPQVIQPQVIQHQAIIPYVIEPQEIESCVICWRNITQNQRVVNHRCGKLHYDCFLIQAICPLCQKQIIDENF